MKSAVIFLLFSASVTMYGQAGSREPVSALASTVNTDSANVRIPYNPVSTAGYITFANAFRWNHSGPTGGSWSDNIADDFIFRPVYSNVASYRLEIFNRNGYPVFESTELQKGWDGYLKNGALASQGVYIWKVSGKYSDGTAFSKAGDVTFIY
ncbi:MAG TPA: gliding motility-associated C-terminal domain-containing protein [Bacteroidales bacterium]|nr:gliding motility-associated C-terminal domain-containing protein [Bacteroidales bacterium]